MANEMSKSLGAIPAFILPVLLFLIAPMVYFNNQISAFASAGTWQLIVVVLACIVVGLGSGFAGVIAYSRYIVKR